MYSNQIFNSIVAILKTRNFVFDENEDSGRIFVRKHPIASLGITFDLVIEVREEDFCVYGFLNGISVNEENYSSILDLLMRINAMYVYSHFFIFYDEDDKNIYCFRHYNSGDRMLDLNECIDVLASIYNRFKKYGKAILSVSLGIQNPEDALEDVKED